MDRVIIANWSLDNWWYYIFCAATLALVVRIISAILRAIEQATSIPEIPKRFWKHFQTAFVGFDSEDAMGDRWFPYILGFLELMIYPFLMHLGLWVGVGAWITLKTVASWDLWKTKRNVFNRFLIGNALVIIFAFVVLNGMVRIELK